VNVPVVVRRLGRRVLRLADRLVVPLAVLLALVGGATSLIGGGSPVVVVAALGAAVVLLMAALATRHRAGGRLSPAVLESAIADAARSVSALEKRTERLERAVTQTRTIARSSDELPAWVALASATPIADAALERGVDPRALLALVARAERLEAAPAVLILADDAIGSIAAQTLLRVRKDARPIILTSTPEGGDLLQSLVGDESRIELRTGTVTKRSFGNAAGPWFTADDVDGLDGVALVFVAGPSLTHGPAARYAVIAGVLELTQRATFIVHSPDERPVARARDLWLTTTGDRARVRQVSPWVIEVEPAQTSG
jgi:hypothetical protein